MDFKKWFNEQKQDDMTSTLDKPNVGQAAKIRFDNAKGAIERQIARDPHAAQIITQASQNKIPKPSLQKQVVQVASKALENDPKVKQTTAPKNKAGIPDALNALKDIQKGIKSDLDA